MPSTSISVPEVHCQHCVDSIEQALSSRDGVQASRVDLQRREVQVTWDDDACDLEDLVATIEDQGYEVAASAGSHDDAEDGRS